MPRPFPSRHLIVPLIACLVGVPAVASPPDERRAAERPDPATVRRFGPAYRYPRAGWIVLHIEGGPYDRGYQHGRLLSEEIADYIQTLAGKRSQKDPGAAWNAARTAANALFLRGYAPELLEEMKGTADGAADAGASFEGRPLDFLDVVTLNSEIELDFVQDAVEVTPTGLESRDLRPSSVPRRDPLAAEHCSAFAATGPATADGKPVIGHITMFSLHFVRHFNVWIDIKPESGHRVLMQTYPGGVQSGMDYYMNDAGLVVAETTVRQTHFDGTGRPLASRIRTALQHCDSIDGVVSTLSERNNGLYTNEWLMADMKTNEIAMFELGTHRSRLWRSSRGEWFGGTPGFYWGCNNAKDLEVRLETVPALDGKPANVVFRPSDRDRAWLRLYERHKGRIGPEFGFEAFTTPPLSASRSLDAKFTTAALARDLTTWAVFGPPLGRTWEPSHQEQAIFRDVQPLVGNDWTLLTAAPPEVSSSDARAAVDLGPCQNARSPVERPRSPVWHGTILPKDDADTWLAAAFADLEPVVALDRTLRSRAASTGAEPEAADRDRLALARFAPYCRYMTAVRRTGQDVPLASTRSALTDDAWYLTASGKGSLLLDALREKLGDDVFIPFMDRFGRAHAGRPVSTAQFRDAAAKAAPAADLAGFFHAWLDGPGLPVSPGGGFWSVDSFLSDLDRTVIVHGTLRDSDAQREAAARLQRRIERSWSNVLVPVLTDREADTKALEGRHVLLIGRPSANAVTARFATAWPVDFGPSSFTLRGETYAHPRSALVVAGSRPDDPRSEAVLFAGLSAEATWRCVELVGGREPDPAEALLVVRGQPHRRLVIGAEAPTSRAADRRETKIRNAEGQR